LAVCDKGLASWGKRTSPSAGRLASMKKPQSSPVQHEETGDFAVIGVFEGTVVLEANEWDRIMGIYRVVTLYLDPAGARQLADQLHHCALGAEHVDGVGH